MTVAVDALAVVVVVVAAVAVEGWFVAGAWKEAEEWWGDAAAVEWAVAAWEMGQAY